MPTDISLFVKQPNLSQIKINDFIEGYCIFAIIDRKQMSAQVITQYNVLHTFTSGKMSDRACKQMCLLSSF